MRTAPIAFYEPSGEFGWLSTFSADPIEIDGVVWPTVEHFFQAQKFADPDYRNVIRHSPSPADAKRFGRSESNRVDDWTNIREAVMRKVLRAKFNQHPKLKAKLLETACRSIQESAIDDDYWGTGAHGSGANRLGVLLENIREELRQASEGTVNE